jgi:hypothetical protein
VGYHLNTTIDVKKQGVDYSILEKEDDIQSSTTSKSVESRYRIAGILQEVQIVFQISQFSVQ